MKVYIIATNSAYITSDTLRMYIDNYDEDELKNEDGLLEIIEENGEEIFKVLRNRMPEIFKHGYETDNEIEYVDDGLVSVSVKFVSEIDWNEELYLELSIYDADSAMGMLTVEYGLIPAVAFGYFDYYTNEDINVYVSPLPEIEMRNRKRSTEYWNKMEDFLLDLPSEFTELPKY